MKRTEDNNKKLFELAEAQQGLFTAKQAEEVGFIRTNHVYHVKAGNWIRLRRGIYRLALFPHTPEQQLVTFALWSQNREGQIQGIYSHDTALSYHDLSDINPSKLHMTVPKNFRRSGDIPKILVLNYASIPKEEIQLARGFLITKPIRTIRDAIEIQSISFEFIEQAIMQALKRGLVRASQIKNLIAEVDVDDSVRRDLELIVRKVA